MSVESGASPAASPGADRRVLSLVFLVVFIDLMGFGILIPLFPHYAEQYRPRPVVFGLLMMTFSLMQFIFSPILGRLSDRVGRRPVLLISLFGAAAGYMIFAFQTSLPMLFLARIVAGVAGGNISTAQAVIADVTTPEKRAKGMGLVGAAFGLGFIFGPAIGGIAFHHLGPRAPGLFASALSTIALLLAATSLPETYPEAKRDLLHLSANGRMQRTFSIRSLLGALSHPQIGILLVIFFLSTFAFANFEGTFALFLEKRLKYDPASVSYLFVLVGVLAVIIQGTLIGRLVKLFGERRLILVGLAAMSPAFFAMAFVRSDRTLIACLIPLAFGTGLTNPSLSSLVSRLATAAEQGGILGIYQSMSSLGRIAGPFWGVYSFESFGIAYPYVTASGIAAAAALLALFVLLRWYAMGRPPDIAPAG